MPDPLIPVLNSSASAIASTSAVRMQNSIVLFQEYKPEIEDIRSYLDRFDCFALVNGIDEEKKAKFFIACVGAVVYQRLLLLAIPKKPTDLSFTEIETLLREEYKKKPLTHVARHNFRQRKQNNGESFRDFYTSLKELSRDCEFGSDDVLKEELKSQLISGIRDPKTQGYYFMQAKLTLDDVVRKAEIDEQAGVGVHHFKNGHENSASSSVHKISEPYSRKKYPTPSNRGSSNNNRGAYRSNQRSSFDSANQKQQSSNSNSTRSYVCYRCNREGHKADMCHFRSATCNKCKRVGHIAVACGKPRESF